MSEEPAMDTVPPVRREVVVDADQATAFEVFTARIGRWWPVGEFSVFGVGSAVAFAGGQIVESGPAGATAVWGTVDRWQPPAAVSFSWHPGRPPERVSHVEVTFTPAGSQTLVTLVHSGWQVFADPQAARAEYDHGWPQVLGSYQARAARPGEDDEAETWVALLHRPGPAAPAGGTVFDDPLFRRHAEFLERMQDAGYLVAAGPLTDDAGHGMTILRLPGAGQVGLATLLATRDDASVAGGLLAVTVRPWQVMMQAAR